MARRGPLGLGRSDLPLGTDADGRFLPWLLAFAVFLAVLALAGLLALNAVAARWEHGVTDTLTVQLMPPPSGDARVEEENHLAVLEALRKTPEVATARPVPTREVLRLLEPWLGDTSAAAGLPLPRLIEVRLLAGAELDVKALEDRLRRLAGAPLTVDDHGVWLAKVVRLIRLAQGLAGLVLLLIAATTVGTVVFTTRTGLAIHHEVIEVLHLIGARDAYVARQFGAHALALGLRGGLGGLALAVPTLVAMGYLAGSLDSGVLPQVSFGPFEWAMLCLPPLAVAALATATARLTVLRVLERML
ncbi:MAG: cell division protein [Hyphomicrobiales bacterium]|nr:cell division protein [Hyphomicrobiales bacterium]MCP5371050.1 cell division protein [Hyphomicrobiales bacterium]